MPDLNNILNRLFQVGGTKESFIREYRALKNENVPIFQFEMDDVALGKLYDSFHISQGNETTEQDVSALANFDGDNTSISERDVLTLQINMLKQQLEENPSVGSAAHLDSDSFSVVNETETYTSELSYEDTIVSLQVMKELKIMQAQITKNAIRDEIANLLPDDKKREYKDTQKQLKKDEEGLRESQRKLHEAEQEKLLVDAQIERKIAACESVKDEEQKKSLGSEINSLQDKSEIYSKAVDAYNKEIKRFSESIEKNEKKLVQITNEAKESQEEVEKEIEAKEDAIKDIDEQLKVDIQKIDEQINIAEMALFLENQLIGSDIGSYLSYDDGTISADASTALARAAGEIGVKEATGNNDGAEIAKYRGGSDNKQPWCASFVSWAYKGNDVFGYDASVSGIRDKAKAKGLYSEKGDYVPKAGDVMIQKDNGRSHTGIVEKVDADGTIHTIEGNASNRVRRVSYRPGSAGYAAISGWVRMSDTTAQA